MAVTGSPEEPAVRRASAAATRAEIERVRRSGVLGRSGRLRELFDFLADRADAETSPKEIEIALTVFNKADAEAVKDDPVARVYIHRLRKRLDDYYLRGGAAHGVRLVLPKGEYRIVGEERAPADAPAADARGLARLLAALSRPRALAAALAALVAVNVAAWGLFAATRGAPAEVEAAPPLWAAFARSDRPLMIVVGDYYLFGEFGDGDYVERLVRDFAVNSGDDLRARQRFEPDRYRDSADVNLRYIPSSAAFALTRVVPALPPGKTIRVALASDVTPETLRDFDIVYVGLTSGLGPLRDPVFAASRFAVGESYDELIDTETGESYLSEAFEFAPYDAMYTDYGLFTTFAGPSGARIAVVAGARDTAVMGVAESVTERAAPDALAAVASDADAFEAIYAVMGQGQVALEADVVAAAPRDSAAIWSAENLPQQFPLQ